MGLNFASIVEIILEAVANLSSRGLIILSEARNKVFSRAYGLFTPLRMTEE
jgi:hypothetical protein